MIIARYLSKQIMLVTAAITFVLVMIIMLSRFLKYLGQASQGELDPAVLMLLMSYRLPEFLQLILPLALLIGILLAYGRMYAENEMTVLIACGFSRFKLLMITLISSSMIAVLVAILALFVTPWGLVNTASLLESQKDLNEFDVMVPGIFQNISRGARTTYTESMNNDEMQNVFMYESEGNRVTVAKEAIPSEDEDGGRFILFKEGTITEGIPGTGDYGKTEFTELGVVIAQREISIDFAMEENGMSTRELLASNESSQIAELQWRLSLVILIPVLTLLAIPLSKVNPRQGRFGKMTPAIIIYIFYFGMLLASRDMVSSGKIPAVFGLWWVHLVFICLGSLLFFEKIPQLSHFIPRFKVFNRK